MPFSESSSIAKRQREGKAEGSSCARDFTSLACRHGMASGISRYYAFLFCEEEMPFPWARCENQPSGAKNCASLRGIQALRWHSDPIHGSQSSLCKTTGAVSLEAADVLSCSSFRNRLPKSLSNVDGKAPPLTLTTAPA